MGVSWLPTLGYNTKDLAPDDSRCSFVCLVFPCLLPFVISFLTIPTAPTYTIATMEKPSMSLSTPTFLPLQTLLTTKQLPKPSRTTCTTTLRHTSATRPPTRPPLPPSASNPSTLPNLKPSLNLRLILNHILKPSPPTRTQEFSQQTPSRPARSPWAASRCSSCRRIPGWFNVRPADSGA